MNSSLLKLVSIGQIHVRVEGVTRFRTLNITRQHGTTLTNIVACFMIMCVCVCVCVHGTTLTNIVACFMIGVCVCVCVSLYVLIHV